MQHNNTFTCRSGEGGDPMNILVKYLFLGLLNHIYNLEYIKVIVICLF